MCVLPTPSDIFTFRVSDALALFSGSAGPAKRIIPSLSKKQIFRGHDRSRTGLLLVLLLVIAALTSATFAENSGITLGVTLGEQVNFRNKLWRVLSDGTIPDPENSPKVLGTGKALLIYNSVLDVTKFNQNESDGNAWSGSLAQTWCTNYYTNWPDGIEKDAILPTSVTETNYADGYYYQGGHYNDYYGAAPLNNEHIFFLSAEEADKLFANDDDRKATGSDITWWLRSPYAGTLFSNAVGVVDSDGWVNRDYVVGLFRARPAFNLDLASVLFSSPISESSDQYKLTLIDSEKTIGKGTAGISRSGNTITVPYTITGDDAATADQVSLLITNKDDAWSDSGWSSGAAAQYYTTAAVSGASGTVAFTLPDALADKVCGTDYAAFLPAVDGNGGNETDYAGAPVEITIPHSVDAYPLWIGGIQADENNCGKLSDNHWSYDPSTHTLTLSGYSYSGQGYNYSGSYYAGIYYNGAEDLTISLAGANSVTQTKQGGNSGDCPIVINSAAMLTVTGSGSLDVQQEDTWNSGPAILSSGAVILSGGTLKAVGAYYNGIKAPSVTIKSTIKSVDVKAAGGSGIAVDGTLINEIAGIGYDQWNRPARIAANTTGAVLNYQHVVFPIAKYTLEFVPNGGSGSMKSVTVEEGEAYELPDCGFDPPDGMKFNWWEVHGMDLIGTPGTIAVITSNCADEDGVVMVKAKWIDADKAPAATVKTAPQAKDLTYSGQGQAPVTAGEAEGGTIWYAIDENDTDVPDSGWSKDIPKGTDAGTYYVWYKAVGDNSHRDSEAKCCEAEIKPKSITGASVTLDQTQLTWTGSEQSVRVTGVTIDGLSLTADDYIVIGNTGTNIDTYTLTIIGKGNFKDTAEASWQIVEKPAPEPEHSIHFFWLCEDCMLPVTGFSGVRPTALREQPKELRYEPVRMRLMIPSLDVESELVRVPRNGDSWSVDWLGADAGILAGSALPGDGLSVIAAHNTLNTSSYGPFALLSSLDMNDLIAVSSEDNSLKHFRVYANELLLPDDMERLAAIAGQEEDALVLVTCENESIDGGYLNRRVVFAKPVL